MNKHKWRLRLHTLHRFLVGATLPRYGYDGINSDASAIARNFPNAAWVAGYDTGSWPWSAAEWGLFPNATHVHIVTYAGANEGDVLDVERGDATPAQTAGWIAMRKAAGYYRPTIYCSAAAVPAVRQGTGKYILNVDYDLWVADWTGRPFQYICADGKAAAATQYNDGTFADYDVAYDPNWPHRTPVVPPPPPPKPPTPTPEPILHEGASGTAVVTLQKALNAHGAHLSVDGKFGVMTLAAVENFQRLAHITVDGVVGPVTWSRLGNYSARKPSKTGAARYVATGTVSLNQAAHQWGVTVSDIVTCSIAHETSKNQKALLAYLSNGNGPSEVMPQGLVYWTPAH